MSPLKSWLSVVGLVACGRSAPGLDEGQPVKPDVILITLDTVRADRIGAWGAPHAQTPTLDALAQAGLRYTQAFTPVPLTQPAHTAILTGLWPWSLGLWRNGDGVLPDEVDTLAEVLQRAGWQTAASVGAFVTDARWGFSQGFDAYFDQMPSQTDAIWSASRPGEAVVDDALAWLHQSPEATPRFLWVHLFDAHGPHGAPGASAQERSDAYDQQIAHLDGLVDRLMRGSEARPTVWIVVGDHGEGMGDHGEDEHGWLTRTSTLHVPWIVAGAGVEPGVVEDPVSIVDLMPSLLARLGVERPEALADRGTPQSREVLPYGSWLLTSELGLAPQLGLVRANEAFIEGEDPELYDLISDPAQSQNLAETHAIRVEELRTMMPPDLYRPPAEPLGLDESDRARLSSLGYLAGGAIASGLWPSVSAHQDRLEAMQQASDRIAVHDYAGALSVMDRVGVVQSAGWWRRKLGLVRVVEGPARYLAASAEAVALYPRDPYLLTEFSAALAQTGRLDAAAAGYLEVARIAPWSPRARAVAVEMWTASGSLDIAERWGAAWRRAYPEDLAVAGAYGLALAASGKLQAAWPELERAATSEQPEMGVHWWLAQRDRRVGNMSGVAFHLEREVTVNPAHRQAMAELCSLWLAQGRHAQAYELAQKLVAYPGARAADWHKLALSAFNLDRIEETQEAITRGLQRDAHHPGLLLLEANLLAKLGKRDEAQRRFEEAKLAAQLRGASGDPLGLDDGAAR